MQKGVGYGSLGEGRYGISGGMGVRPPRDTVPPIPEFTNISFAYGMFNWNPNSSEAAGVQGLSETGSFLPDAPEELDWADFVTGIQDCERWVDQTGSNDANNVGTPPAVLPAQKVIRFGDSGLRNNALPGGQTMSLYLLFRMTNTTVEGQSILAVEGFESGTAGTFRLRFRSPATGLQFQMIDGSGVTTSDYDIPLNDTNWHWLSVIVDTSKPTVADQVVLKLDNATLATANAFDYAGSNFANNRVWFGGNKVAYSLRADMRLVYCRDVADSPSRQAAMYARAMFLEGLV